MAVSTRAIAAACQPVPTREVSRAPGMHQALALAKVPDC